MRRLVIFRGKSERAFPLGMTGLKYSNYHRRRYHFYESSSPRLSGGPEARRAGGKGIVYNIPPHNAHLGAIVPTMSVQISAHRRIGRRFSFP